LIVLDDLVGNLDNLEEKLGTNVGGLVGHLAVRHNVATGHNKDSP
jgi:N-acyl-D-aspartate/D-glutamate deacylase